MITKIYDFKGNFKEIEHSKILSKFYNKEGNFDLINSLYDKNGVFLPYEFAKEHKNFLTLVMTGVTLCGMSLLSRHVFSLTYLYGETAACLTTNIQNTGETVTSISGIWEKLRPLTVELISGSDVLGVLALIYCGVLLLMGQTSKGKKVFKTSIGGYLLIRLAPLVIDIVRIFASATI